jgi:hypothetical protein
MATQALQGDRTPIRLGGSVASRNSEKRIRRIWARPEAISFVGGAIGALATLVAAYFAANLGNAQSPTPTSLRPIAVVDISSPEDGQMVPQEVRLSGRFENLDPGSEIWLVVVPGGSLLYFPQEGPAAVQDNKWISPPIFLGGPGERGERFDVLAVTASGEASLVFRQYLEDGAKTGMFPGLSELPGSVIEYDRVSLVRK